MNVIFYSTIKDSIWKESQREFEGVIPSKDKEVYRTIDSLSRRLHRSPFEGSIAVLFAATREELSGLLSIRELLLDLRIILILPDRKKDTIAVGHKLYPRFLTYVDSDFKNLAAVLEKMLKHGHPKE